MVKGSTPIRLGAFASVALGLAAAASAQLTTPMYEVYKVQGSGSRWAKVGAKVTDSAAWTPLKPGDRLSGGVAIHVPIRNAVQLVMVPVEPPTIFQIESGALVSIDEVGRKDNAAVTRLGLAYGAIRAGVVESESRSDLEIRSPNATLSKRGTWGFRFWVERGTGRWQMSLSERGLIEAIQNNSSQRRVVYPGQTINHMMSRWIESMRFSLPVNVQDLYGLKGSDLGFIIQNNTGFGILLGGGGDQNTILGQVRGPATFQGNTLFNSLFDNNQPLADRTSQYSLGRVIRDRLTQNQINRAIINRNEGNFGIGFGSVPLNTNYGPNAKGR